MVLNEELAITLQVSRLPPTIDDRLDCTLHLRIDRVGEVALTSLKICRKDGLLSLNTLLEKRRINLSYLVGKPCATG